MGNWQIKQEAVKNLKEREKVRKEKLAGYFFNLSQFTFTTLVLGGALLFFQKLDLSSEIIGMVLLGITSSVFFAQIGNNILK